ncbi:MAG: amidohydrolase family protein, partial [Actinomycetota bacterium]|nr:amidohydrolase family protein [Actinomycetota bacterium]
DKAFLADIVTNETGDLLGAIEAMRAARDQLHVDETLERARRAARLLAANGVGVVRSHADTTVENGLTSVEALVRLKALVADVIDVEVVALCGWPVVGAEGAAQVELLLAALDAGADLVGGCPHLEEAGTRAATEVLLDVAATRGVGIDLHTDETLDASVLGLAELAELVTTTGFAHPVTASHCVSLGVQPLARQRAVAAAVAAACISVVALPATNLYLQGRDHQRAMPRGITAVGALRAAGVNVAAGADNLQDPFNPFGRACPLETAALLTMTTHVSPAVAWSMVTDAARRAVGREPLAITPGVPADLLAVRADSLRQAIAFGPEDRKVWHRGKPVPR